MTPKGQGVIRGRSDLLNEPQSSRWPLGSVWPNLWPQKVTGSLKVTVTYFMTLKVTVTFVVGLTQFMTQDVMGHKRSTWPTLWPLRSTWPLTLTFTYRSSIWPGRWLQMSRQHYNVIRQLLCSILTEYLVSSCSFYVMLTKALHRVIR